MKQFYLRKTKRTFFLLLSICAQNVSADSVEKTIRQAIQFNPTIKADASSFDASKDIVDQAKSGFLPTVDVRAGAGYEYFRRNYSITPLSLTTSAGKIDNFRTDPNISIKQILFDGLLTLKQVCRSRHQVSQAENKLLETRENIAAEAVSVLIDVRRLQRLLKVSEENIKYHQEISGKVAQLVKAGTESISNQKQVQARLQDAKVARADIKGDLDSAIARYQQVVGQKPGVVERIKLNKKLIPLSVDEGIAEAHRKNHSLNIARNKVSIAQSDVDVANAKFFPVLSIETDAERDRNVGSARGYQNRVTALVVARWNLFNGGYDKAKKKEALNRVSEARHRQASVLNDISQRIRVAWAEVKSAEEKSTHLRHVVSEKQAVRSAYNQEFSIGKRSLIDNLNAANEYFLAKASLITSDATHDINMINLSALTTRLSKTYRFLS